MQKQRLKKEEYIGTGKHLNVVRRNAKDFPLHAHDYFELEIILEGCGLHQLNGTEYALKRGCVYIVSPADFHKVTVQKPLLLWNITFDESLLSSTQMQTLLLKKESCCFFAEQILQKLDTAAELLFQEDQSSSHIQPLMDYILSFILEDTPLTNELSAVKKAMLFVQTHFRESPSLQTAAAQVCLSPVYFGSLFKKSVGQSYTQYLNSCKINCAKILLEDHLSVTEACFASGFGSLSNFLQVFRQHTGCSPQQYKAQTFQKT